MNLGHLPRLGFADLHLSLCACSRVLVSLAHTRRHLFEVVLGALVVRSWVSSLFEGGRR
jgi:hypothetical protein